MVEAGHAVDRRSIRGAAADEGQALTTARAVTFVAPRRVEIRPVEIELGPGSLLVRTAWSGISGGTESLAFRGEIDPDLPLDESIGAMAGTFSYPFRYGYSCVGEVERGAEGIEPGAHVFAFHPHQDVIAVDPADAIELGDTDPRLATIFPLVETALQIALDAGTVAHQDVVVFGQGAIGVLTSLVLQLHGASVLAVEPSGFRRTAADDLGVEAVPPEAAADAVLGRTGGRGVPLIVEVTGRPSVPASALPLLAHEGTLLVASWFGTKDVALPLGADFHRRRLTIRSTQVSSIPASLSPRWNPERRRAAARGLLDRLPLKRLATHEFGFEDAQAAFEAVDDAPEGLWHAALRYP